MSTVHLRTGDQQIAVHVRESRQRSDLVGELRRPLVDLVQIHALNGHLIEAGGELSVDRDRRRILKERHDSRHLVELRPQRFDGLDRRRAAARSRGFIIENRKPTLLSDENATAFTTFGSACMMSATAFCRSAMDSNEMSCPAMRDAENESAVLARNETCRHRHEQVNGADQHRDSDDHRGELVTQHRAQRDVVGAGKFLEAAFERDDTAVPCFRSCGGR